MLFIIVALLIIIILILVSKNNISSSNNQKKIHIYVETRDGDGLEVHPTSKTIIQTYQVETYSSQTTYEYKIENNKVYWRVIDRYSGDESRKKHVIKDNVIIESELEKFNDGLLPESTKSIIVEIRKSIIWCEIHKKEIAFQLMACHKDMILHTDLRRIIRTEIEKLTNLSKQFNDYSIAIGAIKNDDDQIKFHHMKDDVREKIDRKLEELCKKNDVSILDIFESKKIIQKYEELANILALAQ